MKKIYDIASAPAQTQRLCRFVGMKVLKCEGFNVVDGQREVSCLRMMPYVEKVVLLAVLSLPEILDPDGQVSRNRVHGWRVCIVLVHL